MIDEGFVEDQAGFGLDPAGPSALDPRAAALLRVGACVAIAPAAGLGRVVAAAPDVATALGYDITAALEEPGGH